MAITNVRVESTQSTQIFLATGDQAITAMFFCNQSDDTDCNLDIFLVPGGDVPSTSTQIIKSLNLPKTETYVFDAEKIILGNLDSVYAKSNVDKVIVATISSINIT